MTRLFVNTEPFDRCWEKMGLEDESLRILETDILRNPEVGKLMKGTDGVRKVRISLTDNRGKSAGGRVIYLDMPEKGRVYFLFAYPKNMQANLSHEQKTNINEAIKKIRKELST